MKTILVSVLLQIVPGPDAGTSEIRVMATVTAEFDSVAACKNAIVGMVQLGEASGFKPNSFCAPKDIGELEVEKRKPKPQASPPAPLPRGSTAS